MTKRKYTYTPLFLITLFCGFSAAEETSKSERVSDVIATKAPSESTKKSKIKTVKVYLSVDGMC